jgi:hypothetical protein
MDKDRQINYATNYPKAWRLLVVVMTGIVLWFTVYRTYRSEQLSLSLLTEISLSWFALVPLYGYVFQKAITIRGVWLLHFFAVIVLLVAVWLLMIYSGMALMMAGNAEEKLVFCSVFVAFVCTTCPYAFAIRQYASKSAHLWAK